MSENGLFMTNSILTNLRNEPRKFPKYNIHRVAITWPTRDILLEYVDYLIIERDIEDSRAKLESGEKCSTETLRLLNECQVNWDKRVKEEGENAAHVSGVVWFQILQRKEVYGMTNLH
ncbi:hypothetical protein HK096_009966 [Nowakowskiella sp. JEL0078]|nr:hypothetical protein HK096_009966 [Nowakowskiella sp. JEL0078]